jgi:hypothetical protein
MRCSYTNFKIKRRFGVPQQKKPEQTGPLFYTGCYASVGVLIRVLLDKINEEGYSATTISTLSRIATMLGLPLTVKKSVDPEKKKETEITFSKNEMDALLKLAAPSATDLEINGGKLTRADYVKKDPTSGKDYDKFGQTEEEVEEQKAVMKERRTKTRNDRMAMLDTHVRYFYVSLPREDCLDKKELLSKIDLPQLTASKFLDVNKTVHITEVGNTGSRVAYSGGSSHNKLATKKFWGASWKTKPVLKGDVLIVCTGNAPLDIAEFVDTDPNWLDRFGKSNDDASDVVHVGKKRKNDA